MAVAEAAGMSPPAPPVWRLDSRSRAPSPPGVQGPRGAGDGDGGHQQRGRPRAAEDSPAAAAPLERRRPPRQQRRPRSGGGPVTGNDCPRTGVTDGDPCVDNGPGLLHAAGPRLHRERVHSSLHMRERRPGHVRKTTRPCAYLSPRPSARTPCRRWRPGSPATLRDHHAVPRRRHDVVRRPPDVRVRERRVAAAGDHNPVRAGGRRAQWHTAGRGRRRPDPDGVRVHDDVFRLGNIRGRALQRRHRPAKRLSHRWLRLGLHQPDRRLRWRVLRSSAPACSWVVSQEKCAARDGATTCFPPALRATEAARRSSRFVRTLLDVLRLHAAGAGSLPVSAGATSSSRSRATRS